MIMMIMLITMIAGDEGVANAFDGRVTMIAVDNDDYADHNDQ